MTKGALAVAALISIYHHRSMVIIFYSFFDFAPALKGLTLAVRTFLRSNFAFPLDFWLLQDDHRHGRLLTVGCR